MKFHGSRLLCAAWMVACAGAQAQGRVLGPEELYERVSPSVWLVEARLTDGGGSLGSAVVIAPGTLVTNCHVIEKAQEIAVSHVNRDRRRVPARLQYRDPTRDLCQLQAIGVLAPAVARAPADALRPGAKVYAIGNPRGLELTISDGLVSGLRRDDAGVLQRVQISVPISPGSSGGGLFDVYGRLIGITTSGLRDSQNLNFALPSEWIAELGARARGEPVISRAPEPPAAPDVKEVPAPSAAAPAAPSQPAERAPERLDAGLTVAPGRVFEYRLRDRLSGQERTISLQVDRIEAGRVSFNQGARVEDARGQVLTLSGPMLGETDAAMPPGGWLRPDAAPGASWRLKHTRRTTQGELTLDVEARVAGIAEVIVARRAVQALRVEFRGYSSRGVSLARPPTGRYEATGWYVDGRPVRFEVRTRGGVGGDAFFVDELLELVAIR